MASKIKDVARKAGVSTCTVSRILNGTKGFTFSQETQDHVRKTARKMGYVPSQAGRAVRLGKTYSVALISNPSLIGNSYFSAEINLVLCEKLMSAGYDIAPYSIESYRELLPGFSKKHDGVIIMHDDTPGVAEAARSKGLPVIEMNTKSGATTDSVEPEDFEGAKMLGAHLLGQGYRRLVFCGNDPQRAYCRQRLQGLKASMKNTEVQFMLFEGYDIRKLMGIIRQSEPNLLARTAFVQPGGTTGLSCIYHVAVGMGLEVPQCFGLTSCDVSTERGEIEGKQISGTRFSIDNMAATAADMLLKKMENPGKPIPSEYIPHELVEGQTLRQMDT